MQLLQSSVVQASASAGPEDSCVDMTGLTNDEDYDIRVRATNAAGDGDWGEPGPPQPEVTPAEVEIEGIEVAAEIMVNDVRLGVVQLSGLTGEATPVALAVVGGPVIVRIEVGVPQGESGLIGNPFYSCY